MKTVLAACTALIGAALLAATPTQAGDRCDPNYDAAESCAPLHLIDNKTSISELLRRRAYERGYRDGLHRYDERAPPRRFYRDRRGQWPDAQAYDRRRSQDRGQDYNDPGNPRAKSER